MSSLKEAVVLLHGISRTARMMVPLEVALREAGYDVYNLPYPSITYSIETLAEIVAAKIQDVSIHEKRVHFVGHSMGAIISRLIIRDHRPSNLGRVVMIAPPNQGSPVADFMQRFTFYLKWFGPAGQQIGTNYAGIHRQLPSADYECGIIAGNRSIDPWFSWFLFHGPNDGKVSVEHTKLAGMTDHVVLPLPHAVLPKKPKVIRLVKHFLVHGHF